MYGIYDWKVYNIIIYTPDLVLLLQYFAYLLNNMHEGGTYLVLILIISSY